MKKQVLSLFAAALVGFSAQAVNNVADLSSSNGYLKTTSAPLTGNPTFTIELWVKGTGTAAYDRIIGFSSDAFEISTGSGVLKIYDGSWRSTTTSGLNSGWHHIAITKDASNMIAYVDGVQVYSKVAPSLNFTGKTMFIGTNATLDEKIKGLYDEVRVWNVARTAQEIADNYKKQLLGTESGLINYYQFTEGSLLDKAGNDNTLIKTGTVSYPKNKFEYINDYSLSFDGADYASVASPITGTANFTLEAQFKTTSTTAGYRRIFGWSGYEFEIGINDGKIASYVSSWSTASNNKYNDGKWHHLAVTKSGTSVIFYVDGVQIGTRTLNPNLTGTMFIGTSFNNQTAGDYFLGEIDEVRIWNTVRTANDISTNMGTELVGNESGLIAYYDMNTPTTNVLNLVDEAPELIRATSAAQPQFFAATKSGIIASLVNDNVSSSEMLAAYPNPTSDLVFINSQDKVEMVQILSTSGVVVKTVSSVEEGIQLSTLESGMYHLLIQTESGVKHASIIKK